MAEHGSGTNDDRNVQADGCDLDFTQDPAADDDLPPACGGVKLVVHAVIRDDTDATGSIAANEALSKQRAEAVRAYLIELGVPADAMELSWRGARDPAVKVDARQAERLDLRVEIRLR